LFLLTAAALSRQTGVHLSISFFLPSYDAAFSPLSFLLWFHSD
jgi:hypothetical protein